ncbi:alpha/beta hydrolase [Streptomyces sp. NPDC048172]|uniref:alpha/beta hydrolase n=1 Tax=Streptomyces sp. NPDC048172 TaxID=3365505 RepID=UPI003715A6E4
MKIPAAPGDVAAVMAQLQALAAGAPDLPGDADLSPALPLADEAPGQWVNGSGRPAAEAGAVVYVHGGGFAHTDPRAERALAYRLSRATGRPVFRVDYRLAPAHPFPAALHDVLAVLRHLRLQGVPPSRTVLFGESAGGTLVLSALLALRQAERAGEAGEAGEALPAGAVVVSPLTDMTLSGPSLDANEGRDLISRAVLEQITAQYLAGAGPDEAPQSPLHGDPGGLPPLLLATGSAEVLLDDARRFAETAARAGVDVTLDVYEGMPHVFPLAMLPGQALPTTTTFLRRLAEWTGERCS